MKVLEGLRTPIIGEYYKLVHKTNGDELIAQLEKILEESILFSSSVVLIRDSSISDWFLYELTDLQKALL